MAWWASEISLSSFASLNENASFIKYDNFQSKVSEAILKFCLYLSSGSHNGHHAGKQHFCGGQEKSEIYYLNGQVDFYFFPALFCVRQCISIFKDRKAIRGGGKKIDDHIHCQVCLTLLVRP